MFLHNIQPSAINRTRNRNRNQRIYKIRSYVKLFFVFLGLTAILLVILPSFCDIKWIRLSAGLPFNFYSSISEESTDAGEMGCRVPKLDPFDPSIHSYINDSIKLNCQTKYPMLYHTNCSHLIPTGNPKKYGLSDCCYRNLMRYRGSDSSIGLSRRCTKIQNHAVRLPSYIEFISISCKSLKSGKYIYVDMLSLVPYKPEVKLKVEIRQRRLRRQQNSKYFSRSKPPRLNVVMLGLDSVSHMNFIRTMPRSIDFLKETGSSSVVVGMNGYTKVGDNTYPNAIGFLSGLNESEFEAKCNLPFYDECPFIWNSYSSQAYVTSFGEDAPGISIFNFQKQGFNNTPTDYYIRPLILAQDKFIGNTPSLNSNLCYGPRSGFEILLDYMSKMADTMQNNMKNYFQLIWATSLFHDSILLGNNGDDTLQDFLKLMRDKRYLENTALLLLSDHGMRWGPLRHTWQGKVEEKMPFLYFILPKWVETGFPLAVNNLRVNSKQLTTPYDLHETLKDLVSLENIHDRQISARSNVPYSHGDSRGRSLFLRIPVSRGCEDASIPMSNCVCNPSDRISLDDVRAKVASEIAVTQINDMLSEQTHCAKLSVGELINAAETVVKHTNGGEGRVLKNLIDVGFRTVPGNATFEATVSNIGDRLVVLGDISRTNQYGNQSLCVFSSELKKFCFCVTN